MLLFGMVILVHVQAFPRIPGQQVGPALFPGFLAIGLGVCGALLVMKGLAARRTGEGHRESGPACSAGLRRLPPGLRAGAKSRRLA